MGYVRDTVSNEIRLEGDDFGASVALIDIGAAPAGAKKMQIVFKAHGTQTTTDADLKGWNHTNFFGLRFSNTIPKFPVPLAYPGDISWWPTDFFGIMQIYPLSSINTIPWSSDPGGTPDYDRILSFGAVPTTWNGVTTLGPYLTGTAGVWTSSPAARYQPHAFLDGNGGSILEVSSFSFAGAGHLTSTDSYHMLHAHDNSKDVWTKGWEIWSSNVDRSMYYRMIMNKLSLVGDGQFDCFDIGATNVQEKSGTIHGDVTSNWRSSLSVTNFPRYLMFRHSLPAGNFVFREARVRYFDWDENELEA
jgi:hypothetical protein